MSKGIEFEQNLTEIWPKQNKVCFSKKIEILIIFLQNVGNSGVGGGDGGVGGCPGGGCCYGGGGGSGRGDVDGGGVGNGGGSGGVVVGGCGVDGFGGVSYHHINPQYHLSCQHHHNHH